MSDEDWATVVFSLHPTAQMLRVQRNTLDLWHAMDSGDTPPAVVDLAQPVTVLAWRKGVQPHFQSVDAAEASMLNALQRGTPKLDVLAPSETAGSYLVGTATFGAPLEGPGLTRQAMPVIGRRARPSARSAPICTTSTRSRRYRCSARWPSTPTPIQWSAGYLHARPSAPTIFAWRDS